MFSDIISDIIFLLHFLLVLIFFVWVFWVSLLSDIVPVSLLIVIAVLLIDEFRQESCEICI